MAQADAKQPENGDKTIDSDKHDKQIAQASGDIVSFMVSEMFPAAINHGQQSNHQACPEQEG